MAGFQIYGNRTADVTRLEEANRLLARNAAAEGFVLLKNNGVLPLQEKTVALYGSGARLTVKGGSGSGDVRERYSVNIEDGLKNSGFTVTNTKWLERFTSKYEAEKERFHAMVEKEIKGYPVWKVMDMFQKIGEFKLDYPVGDLIRNEDLSTDADACIYVVARQAGEGFDRKAEKGDYLLSDLEVNNLKICREHYAKLIVIINCGGSLDVTPLEEIGVDAIVYYGQAGEEGGNALGEVLCGKRNCNGKLSDTWLLSYDDCPVSSIAHPEALEENYEEGIYVGYRYFDTRNLPVRYPFGHGLSYTSFAQSDVNVSVSGSKVTISATVKNTGKIRGRETLFVFLYKPNNKYSGEYKSLAAFLKSRELLPNEQETLEGSFDLRDFAVYDEAQSAFVLEAGAYGLSLHTDGLHGNMIAALNIKEDSLVEQCENRCVKTADFKDAVYYREMPSLSGLPQYEITIEKTEHPGYHLPQLNAQGEKMLEKLTEEEMCLYTSGGGYGEAPYIKVMGSCGNTTSRLVKKGIPCIIMADGPAGINIMPKSAYTKRGGTRYIDELPKEWQWGWLKTVVSKIPLLYAGKKDTPVYQYCTAWPNATTLAQTFDVKLLEAIGQGVGKEMRQMGVTLWLAPGLNIHRDPLCGRNFEYYSEDPLVSGEMAAAITRGVQSQKGVGVTVKHFACNNRENERTKVSSNLSERALREIYLKGFRIVCKDQPMALMTSYNRLNGIYTADNKELIKGILREEWGYEGLVMSDWDGADRRPYEEAISAGNNMIMPGGKHVYTYLQKALKENKVSLDDVKASAVYALRLISNAKTSEDFWKENAL